MTPAVVRQANGITSVTVGGVTPNSTTGSVKIGYKYTEFGFGADTAATLLAIPGTTIKYGGTNTIDDANNTAHPAYSNANDTVTVASVSGDTINTNGPISGQVVVTFKYNVKDSKKDLVTLNSASVGGDKKLSATETAADSSKFQVKVAIFSRDDFNKIRDASRKDAVGTVGELVTDLAKLDDDDGTSSSRSERVRTAAGKLDFGNDADAMELVEMLIPGADGDVINVVYADLNPATNVSKSATVDMAAPMVSLVSPSDNFYTNTGAVTLSAEVTDSGAGVAESGIDLKIHNRGHTGDVKVPITGGYKVTLVPAGDHP